MALNERHATLGVISFGLAVGLTWAIGVFALGIVAWLFDWGGGLAGALATLYIGYGPSFVGAIAGAVWAFVDGLIGGLMVAWFYNRFLLARRKALPPAD